MLKIATTSLLLLMGSKARAQGRPVSTTLTCSRAAGLVASQGAVVLGTGVYTYDRYVSSSSSCVLGETIEPAWVPTVDNSQCFVGYQYRQRFQRQSSR
jgi:hypothetical protein